MNIINDSVFDVNGRCDTSTRVFSIDWVSFTLGLDQGRQWLHGDVLLDRSQVVQRSGGYQGYTRSFMMYDSALAAYTPDEEGRRCFFSFGAEGLAALFDDWAHRLNKKDCGPFDLLHKVAEAEGRFNRIDVAFDDFSGALKIGTVADAVRRRDYTSKARAWDVHESDKGTTVYIGSRKSEVFIRIYDKAAERRAKDPAGADNVPAHWVRVEIEFKGSRAQHLGMVLLAVGREGAAAYCSDLLYGLLDFKRRSLTDSNKRRWRSASWWRSFLGASRKARLWVQRTPAKTAGEVVEWVYKSVAPSLAVIESVFGEDLIREVIRWGKKNWSGRHKRIVERSRGPEWVRLEYEYLGV